MKYKKILTYLIISCLAILLISFPYIIPINHSIRTKLVDGSKIRIHSYIDNYSNSILENNFAFVEIKLLKISENTENITLEIVYLYINLFTDENETLDLGLFFVKQSHSFSMVFKYSYAWGKVEIRYKLNFTIYLSNGTSIPSDTGWMTFFTLRPNPDWRGLFYTIIGATIFIYFPIFQVTKVIRNRKRKRS